MSDVHKKQEESIKKRVLIVSKGFEIKIYLMRKKKYPGLIF